MAGNLDHIQVTNIQSMKSLIFLLAMATVSLSFTTVGNGGDKKPKKKNKKEKIVRKLKRNLQEGWQVQEVQKKERFSQEMLDLGIEYALNLSHSDDYYNATQINVLVSKKNNQGEMVQFIRNRAMHHTVEYHFILSRQYLLTFLWPKQQNTPIDKVFRAKLFKQLDWYFEMY